MGKKRKNKDPGRVRQVHPQKSFKDYVAEAAINYCKPFMTGKLNEMAHRHLQSEEVIFTRLMVLEELLLEQFPSVTQDELAFRAARVQDRAQGFEVVDGVVEKGDRVRLEVSIKKTEDAEFEPGHKFLLHDAGSGATLGPELEKAMLGMSKDEVKQMTFGTENAMEARITINMISRSATPAEPVVEELVNVDQNAG